MAKKEERKFYLLTSSGEKFQISELDHTNLKGRIANGKYNGWYAQRGPSMGDRHEWRIQFKDIAGFWADTAGDDEQRDMSKVDVKKRLPPEVGKTPEKVVDDCLHDWNRPETYRYITEIVNGVNRYYKQCPVCEKKSQLIKKREVELAMEIAGQTLDDVLVIG